MGVAGRFPLVWQCFHPRSWPVYAADMGAVFANEGVFHRTGLYQYLFKKEMLMGRDRMHMMMMMQVVLAAAQVVIGILLLFFK